MDELIQEFLVESNENLDRFDGDLVKLEAAPESTELLSSIFRSIHSIKGACGFLGFQKLEKLAHAAENLLSKLRDGQLRLTPEIGSVLLEAGDHIRQMLATIGETGTDGQEEYRELIARLEALQGASGAGQAEKAHPEAAKAAGVTMASATAAPAAILPAAVASATDRAPESDAPPQVASPTPEPEAANAEPEAAQPSRAPEADTTVEETARPQEERKGSASDSTIRVNVTVLDRLMTLVGELVLARNQLLQFGNTLADPGFHAISQHMNLIATELQEEVMKTRMQPIGNIWSKFPRTVRDLVVNCGKEVRIEMEGKDTELDKTIIEAIKDPMTHLVRNSVDHGIEFPDVRRKAGKDPVGLLRLRAFHEGGQVNIEISDDGAGLNSARIRAKAVERGVVSADQVARMSESEIFNLIFLPGVSTAEKVTNVSGRGVGMDVVRTNIERIGGTVDVQSTAGKGTSIRVKIPLTLAIIPALVVTSAGDRFAIPQVALTELVSLEGDDAKGIERVHDAPVYRLRGQLLPLVYLNQELRLDAKTEKEAAERAVNIVVLRVDKRQFGLVVDEINDTEEIVVKPLRKQLKNVKTFAGASIMGDGRVALILDVPGLAQRANLGMQRRESATLTETVKSAGDAIQHRQTLLLFEAQGHARMAIPLSSVARLEEFPRDRVEHYGGQEVVQYRGQIMPLIRVSDLLGRQSFQAAEDDAEIHPLEVVVYTEKDRSVGLVVDHILDIVEESVAVRHRAETPGVLGAAVVQQKVTELLDVSGLVRAAHPNFFEAHA